MTLRSVPKTSPLDHFLELVDDHSCLDESDLAKAIYSSDASIYRLVPQIVAHPRTKDELIALVRAALKAKLPITGRGAGTSCAGNAVGTGLVIDMARHLNRVISVDPDRGTAVVEPGVVQSILQSHVRPHGWRYGPDPSTSNRCTIGGMIGNNACGPRALGYGRSADNIESLEIITGTGELVRLTKDMNGGVFDQLRSLVAGNLATIRTQFGTFSRQVSGYSLEHLLPEHRFNVPAFFAGTEGTLGIITEATVTLVRDAPLKTTVALGYPSMPEGADDMPVLLEFRPTACEGMDRRLSQIVEDRLGASAVPTLPAGDAWIFIELVGDDADEIDRRAHAMVEASHATEGWVVANPKAAQRLWQIRSDAAGLASVALEKPAWAGWEDSAVPPAKLGDYLRDLDATFERFGLHGLPYGHFGDGCVHCRIDFPLDQPDGTQVLHDFMVAAGKLVARYGGSMSGEHGDGRARSELLPLMYSSDALDLFAQVKALFDPANLLNPGVLVNPDSLDDDVRMAQAADSVFARRYSKFSRAVHRCTGVGKCLANTTKSGSVMCPSFQATHNDKDSTRGRSRVLQEMVNGTLIDGWRSPEVAEALELCLACKGCRRDCPTGVDMASFKSHVLFEKYRRRLRPASHYSMGWLPRWGRLVTGLRIGWLANIATQTPGLRAIVKAMAGVDQRRPMPRFRSTRSASAQSQLAAGEGIRGRVAVWVDSFTDAFVGEQLPALVKLLVLVGYDVKVIGSKACCGLTWITTGQLDAARRQMTHALDILTPLAEQGIPIVGMEPSCTAVWRSDAAELLDDPRVDVVSRQIMTLAELLNGLDDWPVPDLSGHTVIAQPHCHHTSVLGWAADAAVLRQTQANVISLAGCCGLAGNFGVEKGHYEVSVAVAEHDLLPAIRQAGDDAIVLADGFSCRKQVNDLTHAKAVTLAQLLVSHMDD